MNYKQYLYEEFLGNDEFENSGHKELGEFYVNPKSIKNMAPSIRGISDQEGNLYVCSNNEYLHGSFGSWLRRHGFLDFDGDRVYNAAKKFQVLLWERDNKTTNFYLSDSSEEYIRTIIDYELEDWLPLLRLMYKRLKEKNPQYNFYFYYSDRWPHIIDKQIKENI